METSAQKMEVIDLEDSFGGPWGWFVKGWHNKKEFLSQVKAHLKARFGEDAEVLFDGVTKDDVEHLYARWVPERVGGERMFFVKAAGPGKGAFPATFLEAL